MLLDLLYGIGVAGRFEHKMKENFGKNRRKPSSHCGYQGNVEDDDTIHITAEGASDMTVERHADGSSTISISFR